MRSLRVRLVVGLSLALCTLWGAVAAWMFADMRHDLRHMLDERLIASARMVAGIVHQFRPAHGAPQDWSSVLNVVARDGVACEVSMVRSEVRAVAATGPGPARILARTEGGPGFQAPLPLGFSTMEKGGRLWRAYVLEEQGVRIATADRIDVREHLIRSFAYTIVVPFALALLASMALMWWAVTRGLRPLDALRRELARRPPGDDAPVTQGEKVKELAPLVQAVNQMLQRVHGAIERERRWSDDAAHELRTPLTAVKTHVQVAQMAVASASQQLVLDPAAQPATEEAPPVPIPIAETPQWNMARDALLQAGEGVEHLQHTMEQLLLLARLECQPDAGERDAARSGAVVCGAEPGMALEALEKAWELAATAIAAGQRRLQWLPGQAHDDARLEDLQVVVPQPLLVSALRNLLENALRHADTCGADGLPTPVHLGLRQVAALPPGLAQSAAMAGSVAAAPCGYAEFTVADQGAGLSAADCEVAVQRFWRKQHQAHGSGLGLAIVQRIARCSGGQLQLLTRAQWLAEAVPVGLQEGGPAATTGLVARLYLRVPGCGLDDV